MARRSQCSSSGENPMDPHYLPPHYREEYRLAVDALVESDLEGYYNFLQTADVVDFLSTSEIRHIQQSLQSPQPSIHPEHPERFLDTGGDGSSDTYWPIHSDQDAPDLDLGWPHQHHFIGPTEVTTLVNPPEPDMPSIKDQARRLVKNAQQVIAVVMDVFTDVDMFADILNAARRNVAVYILLDEQNAHHFVNMMLNCRVDLQNVPFLRVRTVSGITYQCRSGKSFKGQMMNRFLMTDCRAVLSGNYSFMWSYEKLHRSMAHLFLGQLVSTFDEEFRILFAQSKPLIVENVLLAMEEFNLSQQKKQQFPNDRAPLYKDSRRFPDAGHPDEWPRHSYDERMDVDWRMMPPKGASDMYSRFPSQPHMDPLFDQGPPRIPSTENPAFKRYGGGQGRFPYPFQQGVPEPESQRWQVPRGQQLYQGPGAGPEADYSGGEKFWNPDYPCVDTYFEPQEMQPPHNFDHVMNYLSSTRNADFEQSSDKLHPAGDLPFSSSHPRRLSLGQPYTCQTSPTHSNTTDEKQFFPEAIVDRKNPMVKRGLRNWRISSYLSTYDNPEDEDLSATPQAPEPPEEPAQPVQQIAPAPDLSFPKIPNVREFKVHTLPRASQIPGYAKIPLREQPKKLPEESAPVVAERKSTPMPSESSSTHEAEKAEEAEQKEQREPKSSVLRREETFRRQYNPATPRNSRLRSSLIFNSLDQQHSQDAKTAAGQQDEGGEKNEEEQKNTPFVLQVLGQRRPATREWRRFEKSPASDNVASETSKPGDAVSKSDDIDPSKEENVKDLPEKSEAQETVKPPAPQSKPSTAELPKMNAPAQPLESPFTTPMYVDMSDPDVRLMFFKELAAKRKAAKAAEAKKEHDQSVKPSNDTKQSPTVKTKEPGAEETSERVTGAKMAEAGTIKGQAVLTPPADLATGTANKTEEPKLKEASENMTKPLSCDTLVDKNAPEMVAGKTASVGACELIRDISNSSNRSEPGASQSSEARDTSHSNQTEELSQSASLAVFTDVESAQVEPPQEEHPQEPMLSKAVKESSHPDTPSEATAVSDPSLVQGSDESEIPSPDSPSKDSTSLTPSSAEAPSASASAELDAETQRPQSVQSESVSSEQHTGSELACSDPSDVQSSSDPILPTVSPSLPSSSSDFLNIPPESVLSNVPPVECSSPSTSVAVPLSSDNTQEADSTLQQEALKSDEESPRTSAQSECTEVPPGPVCGGASSVTSSELQTVNFKHLESGVCHDTSAAGSEANTSSSQSTITTTTGESETFTLSEKDLITSEDSGEKAGADESPVPGPSEDKADTLPPSLISSVPLPNLPDLPSIQNECIKSTLDQPDPQTEQSTCQAEERKDPDVIPDASQSDTTASPADAQTQAAPPCEPDLTDTDTPPAEAVPCSSPAESAARVLSPGSENTDISVSVEHSSLDTNPPLNQDTMELDETGTQPSKVPTQPDELCQTPDTKPPLSQPAEPPAEDGAVVNQSEIREEETLLPDPGEKGAEETAATNELNKMITQDAIGSKKIKEPAEITSEEAAPVSPQSKQPKTSQSRYHSSTANVLSSSNLRDDTKLLLEQISANSQSRGEATKDAPVTDDEKEDEADKNAKRENARGFKAPGRGQQKSPQDREKVLERIQCMRKERRVYSRFEV
ncbi:protein FAM83H [Betta splendens]|uniref:Protein FAM83H n=1 Tax=Betta splendens TaxID=158456 RepID=A0A6P7KK26_BETSP|nr:protein FAM83H [Betta splendens]XP_028982899.1 protein FAM83H [Betta splendens]